MTDPARRNLAVKKSVSHQQPDDHLSVDAVREQKDPWRWAAERLIPWGKIRRDDYDFRNWTNGASEELLNAGCLYEYARESHKFRCLLALDRRERGQFSGILTEFERSSVGHVHLVKSGWETWLHDFVDELVANRSFAEVWRTGQAKVKQSLKRLLDFNLYPKAVELPGQHMITHGDGQPEFRHPSSQLVSIEICWPHYTNDEIGQEMKRFAERNRPQSTPEPDRRGQKRQSKVRSDLNALSVMRIWKLYEQSPWKRLELVAGVCRYKPCVSEWAAYKERCKHGRGDEPMGSNAKTKMSNSCKQALRFFELLFPWGKPANW